MQIIWTPSPNFNERPTGQSIDTIILHYTDMLCVDAALERLCDPVMEVSCHYLISKNGAIYQLVHDQDRAWHAGISSWAGESNLNDRSIGIELDNPGHTHGIKAFSKPQMDALLILLKQLTTKHAISPQRILAHSDIAPNRKKDPGELFDWSLLALEGYGIWAKDWFTNAPFLTIPEAQHLLQRIGYDCPSTGEMDDKTTLSILAFQRHFTPDNLTGELCENTCNAIRSVAPIKEEMRVSA